MLHIKKKKIDIIFDIANMTSLYWFFSLNIFVFINSLLRVIYDPTKDPSLSGVLQLQPPKAKRMIKIKTNLNENKEGEEK